MTKVIFEQTTVERNENCIALYRRGDEISDADIFQFSDEHAFATANELCEELTEYCGYEICDGNIGKTPCLFLTEYTSHDAKIFDFDNNRDLATACEMAERFKELDDEDDDETADSDE